MRNRDKKQAIERYSNPFERKKLVDFTEILILSDVANLNIHAGSGLIEAGTLVHLPVACFMFHSKPY